MITVKKFRAGCLKLTILDEIIAKKKDEIKTLTGQTFQPVAYEPVPTFQSLVAASSQMNIIAEIKRSSPSRGAINTTVDPADQAKRYEALGAKAISVLTDQAFFNGSIEDLIQVRKTVRLPILCKDFMIDPVQIDRAKAAGANIILLIAAALSDAQLAKLYQYAVENDLEVLVEVHDEEEMERALRLEPEIIGINNRNLKTFEVNLATTERLASMVRGMKTILISESGMKQQGDVIRVRNAGANAVLVGETFMRAENLEETFKSFQVSLFQNIN